MAMGDGFSPDLVQLRSTLPIRALVRYNANVVGVVVGSRYLIMDL